MLAAAGRWYRVHFSASLKTAHQSAGTRQVYCGVHCRSYELTQPAAPSSAAHQALFDDGAMRTMHGPWSCGRILTPSSGPWSGRCKSRTLPSPLEICAATLRTTTAGRAFALQPQRGLQRLSSVTVGDESGSYVVRGGIERPPGVVSSSTSTLPRNAMMSAGRALVPAFPHAPRRPAKTFACSESPFDPSIDCYIVVASSSSPTHRSTKLSKHRNLPTTAPRLHQAQAQRLLIPRFARHADVCMHQGQHSTCCARF